MDMAIATIASRTVMVEITEKTSVTTGTNDVDLSQFPVQFITIST